MKIVIDLEATGLLDYATIDYTTSPYTLKNNFKIHCICCTDLVTGKEYNFTPDNLYEFPEFMSGVTEIIGHNIIKYDLLVLKLFFGLDYTIGPDTFRGKECVIEDTLLLSKLLNSDRYGGHSLEDWGHRLYFEKIDWRARAIELGIIPKYAAKGEEFKVYHPEMLVYCRKDVAITTKVWFLLKEEMGNWPWENAYQLEKKVALISVKQEHRGFWFHKDIAYSNIELLDQRMREIEAKIEPVIPPKKLTQILQKKYTFPAKPVNKDGGISASMWKWIQGHGATPIFDGDILTSIHWEGKIWNIKDLPKGPVVESLPATLKDGTHIKEWLVGLGWKPSAYKEKDLTCDTKKVKLTREKYIISAEKYIEQTLNSNFCEDRLEHLGVNRDGLRDKLILHDLSKPLKVSTNPTFTIGQEKELCPNLEKMSAQFPYAKDIVEWLTYNHRRNTILGGGVNLDEYEEAEKGFLSCERIGQDNRIPSPADTLGAITGRYKHRLICNIPRVTSLFGREMRQLFGCDPKNWQLGSDFVSIEAMIEGHYCMIFPGGKEYAQTLIAEKPNSIHCNNAKRWQIPRGEAKSVKYAIGYGAQPPKIAKTMGCTLSIAKDIFNDFWEEAKPLKDLKDALEQYWKTTGQQKFIKGLDGRKIMTRSKHKLLNDLFQSGATIAAKTQMVLFEERLEKGGVLCDFFKDDWKNKSFAQLMSFYHDELAVEITPDLIKFKTFNSEDEAKAFSIPGKLLSGVGKHKGKYFKAYSPVGEWIRKAAEDASKKLKLRVILKMDYSIGKNWAETH